MKKTFSIGEVAFIIVIIGVLSYVIYLKYFNSEFTSALIETSSSDSENYSLSTTFSGDDDIYTAQVNKEEGEDSEYDEVSLDVVDSFDDSQFDLSDTYIKKGAVFENTGDVPIYVNDIEFSFQALNGRPITMKYLEENYSISLRSNLHLHSYNRPIYPGEQFDYIYYTNYSFSELSTIVEGEELTKDNQFFIKPVYEINYSVNKDDVKSIKDGKVLKEHPYVRFQANNLHLVETEEGYQVHGNISGETAKSSSLDLAGSYRIAIEIYEPNNDNLIYITTNDFRLHPNEKTFSLDQMEEEFDPIPSHITLNNDIDDYKIKINVWDSRY